MTRRFPAPWPIVEHEESLEVRDASGQSLAFLYFEDEETRRSSMKRLTKAEAWKIARGFARLPELLRAQAPKISGTISGDGEARFPDPAD